MNIHEPPQPQPAIVQHLDHINLTVRSLARSIRFYRELFAFALVEQGTRDDGVHW